nr:ATP synthase F0 subunit 8 [Caulophacus iocasicus]WDY83508.1 ATP synthase F0 subunit 8 [Caulophacus iocasicus]
MPHLDTTTYLHRLITFWFSLTILLIWRTKLHYLINKQYKTIKRIKTN